MTLKVCILSQFRIIDLRQCKDPKFLSFFRRITTLPPQYNSAPSRASSLDLFPYFQENLDEAVRSNNRKIDALVKSVNLISARKVFEGMTVRDVVTYNLLISGHRRYGCPREALGLYGEMVSYGIRESASTFSSILPTCSKAEFFRGGLQVHCRVILLGFESNLFVGSSLVDLYMRMGLDDLALKMFDELPERNVALWNSLFRWLCDSGRPPALFGRYSKMSLESVSLNGLSYCYLIRGCSSNGLLDEGKQFHCHVIKLGWAKSNIFVANAFIDFYSACGSLIDATKLFEDVPEEDIISWNSIVAVYADHDLLLDGLALFSRMRFWDKKPSIRSFVGLLNLCSRNHDVLLGRQFHCYVLKTGFDISSVHVQSALIDMYGKCDDIEGSISVHGSLQDKTLECCNSLMTSFMHGGMAEDVVETFGLMIGEGIGMDEVTLSTTLKALSHSVFASLPSCRLLHCCAIKSGLKSDVAVSCSLIDAYSRCGRIEHSQQVFEELASPNVFCFTSIINGYARNGMGRECISLFKAMVQKGLLPDEVTILCILTACNHSGLVEEGRSIFNSMISYHGISPKRQHYTCIVDLLGRAGLLDKAEELLIQLPGKPDCLMWSSLLQNCRVHRNEVIGRRAADVLMNLEPAEFAIYLQVSNFYSEFGEFEASMKIREVAIARNLLKESGYSSVEVN